MNKLEITDIALYNGQVLSRVEIFTTGKDDDSLFVMHDHDEYGEAMHQLLEGKTYSYLIPDTKYQLQLDGKVTQLPSTTVSTGTITTGIDVGTLVINIVTHDERCEKVGEIRLEVRSVKQTYREDYRQMLSDITDCCSELLMQDSSPAMQRFTINPDSDPKTDYQRFAFVRSIIDSDSFNEALHQIQQNPVRRWAISEEEHKIDHIKRLGSMEKRQLVRGGNRMPVPSSHHLQSRLNTLPRSIIVTSKEETLDIPENRFVKFVLQSFLAFCSSIFNNTYASAQLKYESDQTCKKIQRMLVMPIFRNLSQLKMLPLNSPILQKKEGYREILQKWLMFDMASRLTWSAGEDVYEAGKKNVATLYEYWLFFKLKGIFSRKFGIKPIGNDKLITIDNGNLSLSLKQGKQKVLKGEYVTKTRRLQISFYYNRTFRATQGNYEASGSWTKEMRPDYTLSIWPADMNMEDAESQELITHIHFDAKYRVEKLNFGEVTPEDNLDDALLERKKEEEKGTYKNADLYKMHTYKDAIKRTSGAYILYPGDINKQMIGYHEIIPGLGAFAISPRNYDFTLREFNIFIDEVIENFLDRTSQRERLAYHTHEVLQVVSEKLKINLPERIEGDKKFLPSEVNVIVGYCHPKNMDWLLENGRYNMRTESRHGGQRITEEVLSAKYILLWNKDKCILSKISRFEAAVYSESRFCSDGYKSLKYRKFINQGLSPKDAIKKLREDDSYYLVLSHDVSATEQELAELIWDTTEFIKEPFSIKLSDLIKNHCKNKAVLDDNQQ